MSVIFWSHSENGFFYRALVEYKVQLAPSAVKAIKKTNDHSDSILSYSMQYDWIKIKW